MNVNMNEIDAGSAIVAGGPVQKILVKDLKFFYGSALALKGINLPLYKNQVTAFIGPSGCDDD